MRQRIPLLRLEAPSDLLFSVQIQCKWMSKIHKSFRTGWSSIKSWLLKVMVSLIQRYGGMAVFLLSSWPNALFDICGIICGESLMPFWVFFIPLVLGKAVVKIAIQTGLLIFLFSKECDQVRTTTHYATKSIRVVCI